MLKFSTLIAGPQLLFPPLFFLLPQKRRLQEIPLAPAEGTKVWQLTWKDSLFVSLISIIGKFNHRTPGWFGEEGN